MDIKIRKYKTSDFFKVEELLKKNFDVSSKVEVVNNDNFIELVAEIDGEVGGYLLLTKIFDPIRNYYYMHVDYVCVLEEYRNLGVGQRLTLKAIKIAEDLDIEYLELTSNYKRIFAHKLYLKCGFVKRESNIFRRMLK